MRESWKNGPKKKVPPQYRAKGISMRAMITNSEFVDGWLAVEQALASDILWQTGKQAVE